MTYRVLMNFMDRDGWHISFLESDCKTSLPLKLTFAKEDKIRDIFEKHGADNSLDGKHALEHGLSIGRGGVWLSLDEEQYRKLKMKSR
jgi:hypothetical protein